MNKLNLVLLLVVIGSTIGLFYLIAAINNTPLFYFNLIFTCFLELLFFGAIIKVSQKRLFNIPNLALVVKLNHYVSWSVIIMVVFNLGIHFFNNYFDFEKWYYVAIAINSLIFFILILFIYQGGTYQKKQDKEIKLSQENKKSISNIAETIMLDFKRIVKAKTNLDYAKADESMNLIRSSLTTVSTIPLAKLERAGNNTNALRKELLNLQDIIDKFEITVKAPENEQQLLLIAQSANKIKTKANIINKI